MFDSNSPYLLWGGRGGDSKNETWGIFGGARLIQIPLIYFGAGLGRNLNSGTWGFLGARLIQIPLFCFGAGPGGIQILGLGDFGGRD